MIPQPDFSGWIFRIAPERNPVLPLILLPHGLSGLVLA
jgi:hypothetical protein